MKLFKQAQKYGSKAAAFAIAPVSAFVATVHAAVPEAVTTEMSSMKADGITIATAVLVAIIAIFAFKFMRKGL